MQIKQYITRKTSFHLARSRGLPRDDLLLDVDNDGSTLLHLAVESGVAKVGQFFGLWSNNSTER